MFDFSGFNKSHLRENGRWKRRGEDGDEEKRKKKGEGDSGVRYEREEKRLKLDVLYSFPLFWVLTTFIPEVERKLI